MRIVLSLIQLFVGLMFVAFSLSTVVGGILIIQSLLEKQPQNHIGFLFVVLIMSALTATVLLTVYLRLRKKIFGPREGKRTPALAETPLRNTPEPEVNASSFPTLTLNKTDIFQVESSDTTFPLLPPTTPPEIEDVVVLAWINRNKGKRDGSSYPSYFHHEYGIRSPKIVIDRLHEAGLLKSANPQSMLSKLTVEELKELLKSRQLKVSGKKAELIERAINQIPESALLERLRNFEFYDLTEQGFTLLEANEWFFLSKRYDIPKETYDAHKSKIPFEASPRDVVWAVLNQRQLASLAGMRFHEHKTTMMQMFRFLREENRMAEAAKYALASFYLCISGALRSSTGLPPAPSVTLHEIQAVRETAENITEQHYDFVEKLYSKRIQKPLYTMPQFKKQVFKIVSADDPRKEMERYFEIEDKILDAYLIENDF